MVILDLTLPYLIHLLEGRLGNDPVVNELTGVVPSLLFSFLLRCIHHLRSHGGVKTL